MGYTVLFGPSSALVEATLLNEKLPYDPLASFSPVTEVYKISAGLSVSKQISATNLKELVSLARSKPLTYSSFGIGTGPHLLLETFKHAAKIDILHVPYKGNVPGLTAVVSGEVHRTIRPYLESGALRLLAVAGDHESKHTPGVPTFSSLGYQGVSGGSLYIGVWLLAGTPDLIVTKMNEGIQGALASREFNEFLDRFAYEPAEATGPEKLASFTRESIDRWRPIIERSGFAASK